MAKSEELRLVWVETFVKVAGVKKRMAAAKEIGIAQGTVTKHMRKLEAWLGGGPRVLLLDNDGELLPDGYRFLPIAERILAVAEQIYPLLDEARRGLVLAETPPAPRGSVKDLRVPYRGPIPKIR